MKNWQILTALGVFSLVTCGMLYLFGFSPKPISKIPFHQFENSEGLVNSLFEVIGTDLQEPLIFFLGIDPADPTEVMIGEVYAKFWSNSQQSAQPFKAVVIEQNIRAASEMQVERFPINKERERFVEGLKTAEKKEVRLLVIVSPMEASPKLPNSLISLARKSVYLSNPEKIGGLVVTKFPRLRREEEFSSIPCNTGEEDLGQTGNLGCYILQKARFLYRKKFPAGTPLALLDQLGPEEFILLLTREPKLEP